MERGERALALAAAASALWVVFYAAWLVAEPGGKRALVVFTDSAFLVPLALAAVLAIGAAARAGSSQRPFWAGVALAMALWLAGESLWSARDLETGSVPFPWWTDLVYVWFYPVLCVGIAAAFRPQLRRVGFARLLDAGLAVGVVVLLWWRVVLRPLPVRADLDSLAALASPVTGLVVLGLLVAIRMLPSRHGTRGMQLVGVAVLVGVITDGFYTHAAVTHHYVDGSWLEPGWEAEALLYALAALTVVLGQGAKPDWTRFREPRRSSGLVLALAVVTAGALVALPAARGSAPTPLVAIGFALIGLASIRALLLWRSRPPRDGGSRPAAARVGSLELHDRLATLLWRAQVLEEPFALLLIETDAWLDADVSAAMAPLAEIAVAERGADVLDLGWGRVAVLLAGADETSACSTAGRLWRLLAETGRAAEVGAVVAGPCDEPETLLARAEAALGRLAV